MGRLDRLVRVGLDPRRDPDQESRRAARAGAVELRERVEHDQRVGSGRASQQLVLLVVAVDDEALARDAGAQSECELAGRRDVGAETLLCEEPQERQRGEGLRAVHDEGVRSSLVVGASLAEQRQLVVDDERRPELAGELAGGYAAQHELAVREGGGVGQQRQKRWLHQESMVTLTGVNVLLT